MKLIRTASLAVGLIAFAVAGGGCHTTSSSSGDPAMAHVDLDVEASSHDIVVGEVVTLTAHTKDTYGRESSLKWMATAGKLTTEQNGRVARVKFDQPGTYSVSAILMVEGRETRRETTEIHVKPLP